MYVCAYICGYVHVGAINSSAIISSNNTGTSDSASSTSRLGIDISIRSSITSTTIITITVGNGHKCTYRPMSLNRQAVVLTLTLGM